MFDIYLNDNKEIKPPNKVGYKKVNKYIKVVVIALLLAVTLPIITARPYSIKNARIYIKGIINAQIILKYITFMSEI